jgi:hypothetical protein
LSSQGNIAQVPFGQTYSQVWPGNPGNTGGTVLFWNQDLNNTVYIGFRNTVSIAGLDSIPVPPNGMITLGTDRSVYAIAAVGTLPLVVIPGGGSFFRGLTQAQGSLVLPSIRSPNFVTGVSGWIIRKDGSVEFNNGIFRGTVTAGSFVGTDFEITPLGVFFYSGVPANGNLIISIVPPGVVADRFGNVVTPNGFKVYGAAGNGVFLGLNGINSGVASFPSGAANELAAAAIVTALESVGAAQFIATAVEGPRINLAGHGDWVGIQFNSPNAGGTSSANGSIFYVNDAQASTNVVHWDSTGFFVDVGPGNVVTDLTQRNATTNVITQITPSYSIPANLMIAGSSWELELFMAGNQNAVTATTLEFFFQVNGNNTAITIPAGFAAANGAFRGRARMVVTCKIPGPANTASIFINGTVGLTQTNFAIANSTHWEVSSANAQGPNANVDTTVNQLVAISAQWGTSGSLGGLYSRFQRLA